MITATITCLMMPLPRGLGHEAFQHFLCWTAQPLKKNVI